MSKMIKNFDATRQVKELVSGVEPWTDAEARQLSAIARRCLTQHDCGGSRRQLERDNCGACVLMGLDRTADELRAMQADPETRPNYAGWLRVYVEARREVPGAWYVAEMTEAEKDNPAYYNAILRSIKTFGIYIGKAV